MSRPQDIGDDDFVETDEVICQCKACGFSEMKIFYKGDRQARANCIGQMLNDHKVTHPDCVPKIYII